MLVQLPSAFCLRDPLPPPARFQPRGFFANPFPGAFHVPKFGGGLADAEADDITPIQLGVGQIEIAASIEGIQQRFVEGVPRAVAKAHQV